MLSRSFASPFGSGALGGAGLFMVVCLVNVWINYFGSIFEKFYCSRIFRVYFGIFKSSTVLKIYFGIFFKHYKKFKLFFRVLFKNFIVFEKLVFEK